jgi:hypothetical protein
MAKTDLSPTMKSTLHEIYSHGGIVERRPGGYWTWPQCPSNGGVPLVYYGTTTINALVDRGKMKYTAHKESSRRAGSFPIEAQVTDEARND